MWTVCLAEVHDEVSACALLVAVVLLEPFAVGSGRLGRLTRVRRPERAKVVRPPMGESVRPAEPVTDVEPERRFDHADEVT